MEEYHKSVLLREAVDALDIKAGQWYLDCTLGDGGHTLEILKRGGNAIGIDVDPEALKRARERLGSLENLVLIKGNFRDLKNLIQQPHVALAKWGKQTELAESKFSGAIFDLGVSSLQLEDPRRGFSFVREGLIDMRMDPSLGVSALDLLNVLSRKELCELFYSLGEEKYSGRLADAVVRAREVKPFTTTTQLTEVVVRAVGLPAGKAGGLRGKVHPATRVFQALRIAVNDELGALKEGLDQVKEVIAENGRIVVISFHSLEDRIVKNTFRQWKLVGMGEILTEKPVMPTDVEVAGNPRSRSAKMRIFKIT